MRSSRPYRHLADAHDGYARFGIAGKNAALDRSRAAPAGQKRRVHVHAPGRSHGEDLVGQDAPVSRHAERIGLSGTQRLERLRGHARGLEHGKTELERRLLNGRRFELLATRANRIGPRDHEGNIEGGIERPERGHSESRRSHEYDTHEGSFLKRQPGRALSTSDSPRRFSFAELLWNSWRAHGPVASRNS